MDAALDPRLFDSSYLSIEPGSESVGLADSGVDNHLLSISQRRLLQEQVNLSGSDDESENDDDDDDDYDGYFEGAVDENEFPADEAER